MSLISDSNVASNLNFSQTPIAAGESYVGPWEDVEVYDAALVVN